MGSILGPICIQILTRNYEVKNARIRIAEPAMQIRSLVLIIVVIIMLNLFLDLQRHRASQNYANR